MKNLAPKVNGITDQELTGICNARELVSSLEAELKEQKAVLKEAEAEMLHRLKTSGYKGRKFVVEVKPHLTQKYVNWRRVVVDLAGEDYAKQVSEKAGKDEWEELVIKPRLVSIGKTNSK